MRTVALRRVIAPLAYVACLFAGPAVAQVGPAQPVIVLSEGKSETLHTRPDLANSYSIPGEISVAADGRVTRVALSAASGGSTTSITAAT